MIALDVWVIWAITGRARSGRELRGVARTPAEIAELEGKTRATPRVRDVENLLHPPGTPAVAGPRAAPGERGHKTPP